MTNSLVIEIQYLLKNRDQWESIKFNPEEYFDLETDETIELDCIPKYNHAIDYIKDNLDSKQIIVTKIILIDLLQQKKRQITERFWNNSQNRLIERKDIDLNTLQIQYHEIILETQIKNNPSEWEIIRLIQENGIMIPIFHSIIKENLDGSQTETQIAINQIPHLNFKNSQTLSTQLVQ